MDQTIATPRQDLDSRLETLGWGLFFLMSGVVLLLPKLPDGSWLTGFGAILLGLSAVRFSTGLPVSRFAVVLGTIAVASGIGTIAGLTVPWLSLLLIPCGLALVAGELIRRPR